MDFVAFLVFLAFLLGWGEARFGVQGLVPMSMPAHHGILITVQFLSELSVALGAHSLLRRSRQHNASHGVGGCHAPSLFLAFFVFVFLWVAELASRGAPHMTYMTHFCKICSKRLTGDHVFVGSGVTCAWQPRNLLGGSSTFTR